MGWYELGIWASLFAWLICIYRWSLCASQDKWDRAMTWSYLQFACIVCMVLFSGMKQGLIQ